MHKQHVGRARELCLQIRDGIRVPVDGDQAPRSKHRTGVYALHVSAAFLLCFLCITRLFAVHRDASLSALRSVITIGPAKGIITTEKSAAEYSEITDAVLRYAPESGSILVTSHAPFCYLITDLHPAAHSVWNSPYTERLKRWYDKNPDRLPDMIVSIEKGIGFSNGNGNLEAALDDMKEKGRDYSIVYSSSVCRVLLTDQQDPF